MTDKIITIGREYGSGGRDIGKELAKRMGVECYDSRLLLMAAEKNGELHPEVLASVDEKKASPWLYSMQPEFNHQAAALFTPVNDTLFRLEADIIRDLAKKGSCIIIGRCADYILRDMPNLRSVFINADLDSRIKRVMERQNLSEKAAASMIRRIDKERSGYYNFYTDKKWGAAESYDIVMNSSRLGVETCINIIASL